MRCWCQDANCCINFGHFKLKVVILICLEVAQSEVVTTSHPLDASAAHKFAALTPRSVKHKLRGQVVSAANQVRSSSQENMENISPAPAPGLFRVYSFTRVCKKLVLSSPPRTISNISASGRNQQKEYGTEREGASRGSCQNTNEILN